MKIFNWVHKHFHHNVHKDGSVANVRKIEAGIVNDGDTQELLRQIALVEMLEGWNDGVFKIGTFGFDPIQSLTPQNGFLISTPNHEEEYYSDEHEEEEEEKEENVPEPEFIKTVKNDDTLIPKIGLTEICLDETGNDQMKSKNKGDRITLADLFMKEESEGKTELQSVKMLTDNSINKESFHKGKNGASFAKKLIPKVGEDSLPIKKLHHLMKRMLKKRIHPELQGKVKKMDALIPLSLLQTQDGVACA